MGSSDGRAYRRTDQLHDGYRRRNDVFLIALLVSLALHAATILLAPGFRRPAFKIAETMNVLLMPAAPSPAAVPKQPPALPEVVPPPKPEPEPAKPAPQPEADVKPEPVPPAKSPPLAMEPAPVPESVSKPKPAPKPKPEPQPEPAPRHARPEVAHKTPPRHHAAEPPVHRHAAPAVTEAPPSTTVSPRPATPSAATPPPQQPRPAQSPPIDDLLDRYGRNLARIVASGQHYPRIAQMRGWQGTVEIEVAVAPPGKADGITIQRSSGHQVLDDEALDMVKRALPLPEPPRQLRDRAFTVVVPIVFRLRQP